ncbi:hypothetical protein LBMAG42_13020 [Deltaproteobacteria bacterium]|nr:hypothetical protein LBMAG42_13020 [Deltaproteobacteria bacterium]
MLLVAGAVPGCFRQYVFSRLPQPVIAEAATPTGLTSLSTATCAACHVEIAAEWGETLMGRAWTDPVFQADFVRGGELYACRYCHTPLPQQQPERITGLRSLKPVAGQGEPNPNFEPSLLSDGVGCAACHVRAGAVVGSLPDLEPPHGVTVDPGFGDAELCATCHQASAPPFSRMKRPIADTVGEWARWQAATGRTESCVDCHMPAVERALTTWTPARPTRSHRVLGGWDDEFVASAIRVGPVERTAGGVALTLTNLAGHNVPTADPMRALDVVVRLGAAPGAPEARTTLERVVTDRTYVESRDTTLLPGEARVLTLPFAEDSLSTADVVVVELVYDRLRNAAPDIQAVRVGSTTVATQTVSLPRRP